jgi:hypothetical protein
MRRPNPRLATMFGDELSRVTVLVTRYRRGRSHTPEPVRVEGPTYTAVVSFGGGGMAQSGGSESSVETYTFMLYSDDDPAIRVDYQVRWGGRTFVVQDNSYSMGPGAWGFTAVESGTADRHGEGPQ